MEKDKSSELIELRPVRILKTAEDKYGSNISKMSDFYEAAINQSTELLQKENKQYVKGIVQPIDLGLISEVLKTGKILSTNGTNLVPDFDSLSDDIKEKMKTGQYEIGLSKQDKGNYRSVLVDTQNHNQRVKDITLKRVVNTDSILDSLSNISTQMQLRNINRQLSEIRIIQEFQLEQDRNINIKSPFLSARSFVLKAQNSQNEEERKENLKKADENIQKALNNIFLDMETSSKKFVSYQKMPIARTLFITNLMNYLQEDFVLATKFTGFRYSINYYLDDKYTMDDTLETYRTHMRLFVEDKVNKKGDTVVSLLHKNYSYTKENLDAWYYLQEQMLPILNNESNDEDTINYVVTVED